MSFPRSSSISGMAVANEVPPSETVLAHATQPRNAGVIPNANGFARVTGDCGDTMAIWLKLQDAEIVKATFWTDGCAFSVACGSAVTELAKGRTLAECRRIGAEDILRYLGGLPEAEAHCATLAATTLQKAVENYLAMAREPWKQPYQRQD